MMDNSQIILSALQPETISHRILHVGDDADDAAREDEERKL